MIPAFIATIVLLAQSMFGGAPIDGIGCDAAEGVAMHVHAHLQLFDRGRRLELPANIGIPMSGNCLYWLHTHAPDGIIHIESPVKRPFTLGQFFDIWGPELSWTHAGKIGARPGKRLAIWVNGRAWHGGSPRSITLSDREEIVIQAGPPYGKAHPGKFP